MTSSTSLRQSPALDGRARGARLPIGRAPDVLTSHESVGASGARSRADEMRFYSLLGYMLAVALRRTFEADAREARAHVSAATACVTTDGRTTPASLATAST